MNHHQPVFPAAWSSNSGPVVIAGHNTVTNPNHRGLFDRCLTPLAVGSPVGGYLVSFHSDPCPVKSGIRLASGSDRQTKTEQKTRS